MKDTLNKKKQEEEEEVTLEEDVLLLQTIRQQLEFYFGDTNLPTDKFLLAAMKKQQQGKPTDAVSLDVVMSFKKMKALLRDAMSAMTDKAAEEHDVKGEGNAERDETLRTRKMELVERACGPSCVVVVSLERGPETTIGWIRRQHPLPSVDYEDLASRTVILEGIEDDAFTVSGVQEMCSVPVIIADADARSAHAGASTESVKTSADDADSSQRRHVKMVQLSHGEGKNDGGGGHIRSAVQEVLVKQYGDHSSTMSSSRYALVEFETIFGAAACIAHLGKLNTSWRGGLRCRPLSRQHFNRALMTAEKKKKTKTKSEDGTRRESVMSKKTVIPADGTKLVAVTISVRGSDDEDNDDDVVDVTLSARKKKKNARRQKKDYRSWASAASQHEQRATAIGDGVVAANAATQLGPKRPDGTRGFSMGRGRPVSNGTHKSSTSRS